MKKRNVFELLALKEKISANNYSKKLQGLSEESSKVTKILNQLEELSENRENSNFLPAWQLKSSANIQEKINHQKEIAKYKLLQIKKEKKTTAHKLAKHEIRRKKSLEKSKDIRNLKALETEKKIAADLSLKNNKNKSFRWH